MDRFRDSVNPNIYYDGEGRLLTRRSGSLPRFGAPKDMRSDGYYTYDPYRDRESRGTRVISRIFRREPERRYVTASNTPIAIRRFDDHRSVPALTYKTSSNSTDYAGNGIVRTAYSDPVPRTREIHHEVTHDYDKRELINEQSYRSTTLVEERIIPTEKPMFWWLFIILGILLIVTGIIQILLCIDFHYYSRIWTGVLLIMFGAFGFIHGGNYKSMWKNYGYIILGLITSVAVYACTAFNLITLCHNTIQISEENGADWTDREENYWLKERIPKYKLDDSRLVPNIWLCYSIDWVVCILLMVALLVLTTTVRVFNHYYDANFEFIRVILPFCDPVLFNPFGQISLGQAIIYVGLVLKASVHGNNLTRWQNIWAPVWAGVIPVIAGFVSSIALKRSDKDNWFLAGVGLLLQFFAFVGIVVALVVNSIGMYDNIVALGSSTVMSVTGYSHQLLTASILLFCLGDVVLIAGIIYVIAIFVRLLISVCCDNSRYEQDDIRETVYPPREKITTISNSRDIVPYRAENGFYNQRF